MAYQSLNLGSTGDDGTGDSMRVGGDKINDNFSEIYTLLGTGTALTTGMSATGSVITLTAPTISGVVGGTQTSATITTLTGTTFNAGTLSLAAASITDSSGAISFGNENLTTTGTFQAATITATTAVVPDASDGASLGTASLEWSDLFLADGALINFGNDQDVTITHDADDGLVLKSTATADDNPFVLTIQTGETDIALNDVIGQIDFQAPDEGTGTDAVLVAAGIAAISEGDFSSSNNATKLSFKTAASEAASEKMSLSSAGLLTIADDLMIKDGGTIGVASTNDAITISSAGIVTLKDDLVIKDGGTIGVTSAATAITIASTGIVTFVDDILIKDAGTIGVASSTSAISIASTGIVTFVDDILIKDAGTIGSATTPAALTIASGGGVTFSAAPVFPDGSIAIADLDIDGGTDIGEDIVDADLFVIDNGAGGTNRKVAASRIKSYAGGGGWTLIQTDTVGANSILLPIEPTFSTTYDIYQMRIQDVRLEAGDGSAFNLKLHMKFDGAYKTGTNTYSFGHEKIDNAATRTVVDETNDAIELGNLYSNLNGIITIWNPLRNVGLPCIGYEFVVTQSSTVQNHIVAGMAMYTASLTSLSLEGLRFSTNGTGGAGEFDSNFGIINTYGAPMA